MRTLINVCGGNFSGTTMLDMMLGSGVGAFSCGEVASKFRPTRHRHDRLDCACGADPCPVWKEVENVSERHFHREALARWKVQFIVDSSKQLPWLMDNNRWAAASGLRVFNVLIWKEPLSHAHSYVKRGGTIPYALFRYMRYYRRFLRLGLPFISVNYHQLVQSPEVRLAQICNAVDMPYSSGQSIFWEKRHHLLYGNFRTLAQLGIESNCIRKDEILPPEFEATFRRHLNKARLRSKLEHILDPLIRSEISQQPDTQLPQTSSVLLSIPPCWYYGDIIKRIGRSIFGLRETRAV